MKKYKIAVLVVSDLKIVQMIGKSSLKGRPIVFMKYEREQPDRYSCPARACFADQRYHAEYLQCVNAHLPKFAFVQRDNQFM